MGTSLLGLGLGRASVCIPELASTTLGTVATAITNSGMDTVHKDRAHEYLNSKVKKAMEFLLTKGQERLLKNVKPHKQSKKKSDTASKTHKETKKKASVPKGKSRPIGSKLGKAKGHLRVTKSDVTGTCGTYCSENTVEGLRSYGPPAGTDASAYRKMRKGQLVALHRADADCGKNCGLTKKELSASLPEAEREKALHRKTTKQKLIDRIMYGKW